MAAHLCLLCMLHVPLVRTSQNLQSLKKRVDAHWKLYMPQVLSDRAESTALHAAVQ